MWCFYTLNYQKEKNLESPIQNCTKNNKILGNKTN